VKRQMLRQGDVLLKPVRSIPKNATAVPRDRGRVILAYGEATGHAHEVADHDAAELLTVDDVRYLRVDRVSALVHQEHSTLELAVGGYEVIQQREYTPTEIRNVAD
jgi:hypothetical protein